MASQVAILKPKFYLCSDGERTVVLRSVDRPKTISYGGKWTSTTCGYDSDEECRKFNGVPDEPCRECGQIFPTYFIEQVKSKLLSQNICHSCNHWKTLYEQRRFSSHVVVAGTHYEIGPVSGGESRFSGFGGREFNIRFFDGREVNTSNLWCQGVIPKIWRERIPDNAEFLPVQRKVASSCPNT